MNVSTLALCPQLHQAGIISPDLLNDFLVIDFTGKPLLGRGLEYTTPHREAFAKFLPRGLFEATFQLVFTGTETEYHNSTTKRVL